MPRLKVVAVSDNTNAFGLRGVVFVGDDGSSWQAAASSLHVPEKGRVFEYTGSVIPFYQWGFEIPERLALDPPPEVVAQVWPPE